MKRLLYLLILFSNLGYAQVNKPQHDPPETINKYAAATGFDICTNSITVADATGFGPGDTVLLIQMKGAIIDTSNSPAFGTILDYGNAGNYEFNLISQRNGNQLTLLNKIVRTYDIPEGVVQLVRVPKYKSGYFSGGLTCDAWDGAKGGIIAVHSTLSLTSVEDISVYARGFRGATAGNASINSSSCGQNNYYYPATSDFAALRGESIGTVPQNMLKGKGNIAGGGGGGNSHNSGGGGGGNAGSGGNGGFQSDSCSAAPLDNGGRGGKALNYNSTLNKIFMGSGGGAGQMDNTGVVAPKGGNGGGIIIIITEALEMFEELIIANGEDASICGATNCNDGNSGGGAGGTILLNFTNVIGNLFLETKGGKGADTYGPISPGGRAGPGGGGGGGVSFLAASSLPANVTPVSTGGQGGVIIQDAGNSWGATAGQDGLTVFDWVLPVATDPFKKNIDSVRIQHSINYCNNVQFTGLGYTNTFAIANWYWDFGDGGTASIQDPVHDFPAAGNYTVKLVITDVNGCKDSITSTINTAGPIYAEAGNDTSFCAGGPATVVLNGNGNGNYSWSPASLLNNNNVQNPIATINTTTKFYLTMTNGAGCSAVDSVTITIKPEPLVQTLPDTSICSNATLILTTTGAVSYSWDPPAYVDDPASANPRFIGTGSQLLIVTGTAANGCSANDTVQVVIRPPVVFNVPPGKSVCKGEAVQLDGNNGDAFQYTWSPALYLDDPNVRTPFADPPSSRVYTVNIKDNTCNTSSSFNVNVTVLPVPVINATASNDINCNKPYAQLNATGGTTYVWSPTFGLSDPGVANPIANPVVTTTYHVAATDVNGCSGKDSINLVVNFGNNGIILPNSFTPNGDGVNDCFGLWYYRDVQDLEFFIYNKFGHIVFETRNPAECWNGWHKGQRADAGSYVYYIKARTLCGNVHKSGNILLLK